MWNFNHGDRVARGDRLGTVTRQLLKEHWVYVNWDDEPVGVEEGIHDDSVTGTQTPAPPRPPEVW